MVCVLEPFVLEGALNWYKRSVMAGRMLPCYKQHVQCTTQVPPLLLVQDVLAG